jgi:hypothetical protein
MIEKIQSVQILTDLVAIHRAWPTFNNSLVIFAETKIGYLVLHFDCKGQEIYRYTIEDKQQNSMCLIDDRNIAVTELLHGRIT